MAGYWPSSLFFVFMDRDEVEVHKDAKRLTRLIRYLDLTSLVNKGFIIWHSRSSCRFVVSLLCLPVFVAKCILEIH